MKFTQEKLSGLSGETEVRFTEEAKEDQAPFPPLVVTASKRGVMISGSSTYLETMQDLQEFAGIISEAWAQHKKLLGAQIHIAKAMPG
jgi:hypothetical protein